MSYTLGKPDLCDTCVMVCGHNVGLPAQSTACRRDLGLPAQSRPAGAIPACRRNPGLPAQSRPAGAIPACRRNPGLPSFGILFRPGLGYYPAKGEAQKSAVFLRSDLVAQMDSNSRSRSRRSGSRADWML